MSTTRLSVTMPTIGKTSGGNLISLIMILSVCAKTGKERTSLLDMMKVVNFSVLANIVTAGKNKNITLCATKFHFVKKKSANRIFNALFITTNMIGGKSLTTNCFHDKEKNS
jgi:hypothetical protein